MKIKSAKAKGRRLVKDVVEKIKQALDLSDHDIFIPVTSCPGMDIHLSAYARTVFPFAVECKNQENLNIWKAYDQALRNCTGLTPVVIFSRNHSKILVTLELNDWLSLLNTGGHNAKKDKTKRETNDDQKTVTEGGT